jgi:YesN/AraC family two-component response regulator
MSPPEVVIADDEKQLRIYLRSKLAKLWPELVITGEAENGYQALDLIEAKRPGVAFLDIKMPGLSGLEVAKSGFSTGVPTGSNRHPRAVARETGK